MTDTNLPVIHVVLVEEEVEFTLVELSHACHTDREELIALVDEGVLTPSGSSPQQWRFGGTSLRRARVALRLTRDLELSLDGVALVLDLIEEIDALRAQLRLIGFR